MSEEQRTKEDEELEEMRAKFPNLRIRKATPEERAQHRIFIGRPPVAGEPRQKGIKEERGEARGRCGRLLAVEAAA